MSGRGEGDNLRRRHGLNTEGKNKREVSKEQQPALGFIAEIHESWEGTSQSPLEMIKIGQTVSKNDGYTGGGASFRSVADSSSRVQAVSEAFSRPGLEFFSH